MHVNCDFAKAAQPRNYWYSNTFLLFYSTMFSLQCIHVMLWHVLCTQVFTRLNHLNITLSYKVVLQNLIVTEKGERHLIPLQRWLKKGERVQLIGDNVHKRKSVTDIRSDSQANLHNMYSMIACIPPPRVDRFTPLTLRNFNLPP